MKDFIIVIPARYNSSRLPGKPLKKICGKSMIFRTYEVCLKVVNRDQILVATDDFRIVQECKKEKMNYILTSKKCLTGTDRIAEVAKKIKKSFYINLQGDEPLFNPKDLKKLIKIAKIKSSEILNGYCEIKDKKSFFSTNIPKVVFNNKKELIYMSRAPIPLNKKNIFLKGFRQVCAYSFPYNALKLVYKNKKKTFLEKIEDIELLRFVENGFRIKMIKMTGDSISVDTFEDLQKVRDFFRKNVTKN